MAAAEYVLGIFAMVSCFTTGSVGLSCHFCKASYESNDVCVSGNESETHVCDANFVWPELILQRFAANKGTVVDLPPEKKAKEESNLACIKIVIKNSNNDNKTIWRSCSFKKFGNTDGCGMLHKLAKDVKLASGATAVQSHATEVLKRQLYVKYEKCSLCYTDNCNATIELTPTFFIYPPSLVLVLIVCKPFFQ